MSHSLHSHFTDGRSLNSVDDAENGLYDSSQHLIVPLPMIHMNQRRTHHVGTKLSPSSPVHEGITPLSSVPELDLLFPLGKQATDASTLETTVKKPGPAQVKKPKIGRWILFNLWFNTYRKFFTFITLLNLTGIILAAIGRFPYAEGHIGALVLGNLLCAILMRNELWMRFLYMVAIYGLRSVRSPLYSRAANLT